MNLASASMRDIAANQAVILGNDLAVKTRTYSASKTSLVYVQPGEVGTPDYVTGSEGQVKTITESLSDDTVITVTSFKYEDVVYPTKATEISVVEGV